MEFINPTEFKNQSKEVQEIFIKWWEPKPHDLIGKLNGDYCLVDELIQPNKPKNFKNRYIENKKYFPLFTEGQLRKFIEEKTACKLQIYYNGDIGYTIQNGYSDSFAKYEYDMYENLGEDLLQAYWKVACEIAKESV